MKRNLATIIGILLIASMIMGCGGSDSSESATLPGPGGAVNAAQDTNEESSETTEQEENSAVSEDEQEKAEDEQEEAGLSMSEDEIEKAARDILNEIDGYKWDMFMDGVFMQVPNVGDSYEVQLTNKEKARIAAGSAFVKRDEEIDVDPGWIIAAPLDKEGANDAGLRIFGEPIDIETLDNYYDGIEGPAWMDGDFVDVMYIGETDTDMQTNEIYVHIAPDQILLEENIFEGHWSLNHDMSNFVICYIFEEQKDSEYGIVLSEIHVDRIGKDEYEALEDIEEGVEVIENEAFYGIWVGASKKEDEAYKIVDKLNAKGISDACVLLSSDWSNLNSDPYYVVTAGKYDTEDEAKADLTAVKSAGFNDAYVKNSGDYIGD